MATVRSGDRFAILSAIGLRSYHVDIPGLLVITLISRRLIRLPVVKRQSSVSSTAHAANHAGRVLVAGE